MFRFVRRFLRSEGGSSTAEYAVLIALVVLAFVAASELLAPAAGSQFESTGDTVGTYGVP